MSLPDSDLILALDFGGTKNSAALLRRGERDWHDLRRRQSTNPTGETDWRTMVELGHDLLHGTRPLAVGISFGGPASSRRGEVILSHHVPGWEGFPIVARVESEFGAPAVVDNDANIAALGESRYGAGRGASSVLYVTVSTGIGGGWVLDGKIHRGYDEMAGEIGHLLIDPGGRPCICGRRGCLETIACGPAIAREAREHLAVNPKRGQVLRESIGNDLSRLTAQVVNEAALAGDELAREVMDGAARALGLGIGSAIALMNPQRVIIGGGVSKSGQRYFEVARAAARGNCLPEMHVEIVPAALGDDAPLWGAVALAEDLILERGLTTSS